MRSGLSGSCQSAFMLAQDYEGKVEVVDNQRISVTQHQAVLDALELIKRGKTAKEILETNKLNSSISVACYIGPGALAIACCQKMDYDNI